MKKINLYFFIALIAFASCSDDDDVVTPPDNPDPVENNVVINEIRFLGTDLVEIFNQGDQEADLSDYWLCLGPGTYQRIGEITPESGSVVIPAGGYLVLPYNLPDTDAGLGLYSSNEFTNADALVDFVQYGSGGSAREDVAVAAGLWAAGEFVPATTDADNSIIFDGEGNGAANWAETTTVTFGAENVLTMPVNDVRSIVFNEVNYGEDKLIELWNNGTVSVDLAPYWLCLGPGQYLQIENATVVSGNRELAPGEFLVVNWDMLSNNEGLGLYSTNTFASADAIVDFVQWGSGGNPRENVAVEAGIWTTGDFIPEVRLPSFSIAYDGEGDASTDWEERVNPTFGQGNATAVTNRTFAVTIRNTVNYLYAAPFAENAPVGALNGTLTKTFKAVPGAKLNFATMSAATNDWFFGPRGVGIDLFNGQTAVTGDITDQVLLWDLGTEEEEAAFIATVQSGPNMGNPDDDNTVRIIQEDVSADIRVELAYDEPNREFTLTITNLQGAGNGIVITPGLVVLHAQNNPLFTLGQPDRGVGLEAIAEDGLPAELNDWFNELGTQGTPLRLSSSLTPLSPSFIYAFNTDRDPWFTQGEAAKASSGLEEIAEDGDRSVAYNYLKDFGIPTALPTEAGPIMPGGVHTFTIEVPEGQDYKLGFGTMFVQSNDWFISTNNVGLVLFNPDGSAFSGVSESSNTYLYDAGTEDDEPVGFGPNQVMRQTALNTGPADADTSVRRVSSLEDVQFGKGVINSGPGVTWFGDPRGGYNLIEVEITPQ